MAIEVLSFFLYVLMRRSRWQTKFFVAIEVLSFFLYVLMRRSQWEMVGKCLLGGNRGFKLFSLCFDEKEFNSLK